MSDQFHYECHVCGGFLVSSVLISVVVKYVLSAYVPDCVSYYVVWYFLEVDSVDKSSLAETMIHSDTQPSGLQRSEDHIAAQWGSMGGYSFAHNFCIQKNMEPWSLQRGSVLCILIMAANRYICDTHNIQRT
ncbi:hypothetical protein GDO81_018877 [Engystomops pustulosus]|uniref:Uncharacterized protein n=1 Tax=Engystomops pustulosus TaxID=76066 RepID=A0AAV6YET3_ENGPU|nr:hypothetical protein GDO81_018877 [Engystomops pustulosus]